MRKGISVLLALLLIGCTTNERNNTQQNVSSSNIGCDITSECKEGSKADMSAYDQFMDSDHVFLSIDMEKGNELLMSDESFVIYYGFSTCPWCVELLPILNDVAKKYEYPVRYVNVREGGTDSSFDIRTETNPDYTKLVEIVNDYLPVNNEGVKRLSVPFVFFVKSGEIVETQIGTLDSHDATERVMTDDEIKELNAILDDSFQKMKDN